jgi:hypothetical protein
MKYQGKDIYKNTANGDVLATDQEARKAKAKGQLIEIGCGKDSYFVIETTRTKTLSKP